MTTKAEKKKDDEIVKEAQKRFTRCQTWESTARARWLDDYKFCNADADNLYQWPQNVLSNRGYGENDERPHLTVNKTRQHCLQVINDARQNKSSIKIVPTGDEATYESAQIYNGLIRHIEYVSNAQSAYGTAIRFQVEAGLGFTRVSTDYVGDDTLDQDILIDRIKDPMSVYLDPNCSEADCSDARFGFIFDDMPKDVFDEKYPKYKDKGTNNTLGESLNDGWVTEDQVRVAEYFRKVTSADRLVTVQLPDGTQMVAREGKLEDHVKPFIVDDPATQRDISEDKVEWFLIVGDEIADRRDWPGKYIPIVPWIGETTVIDGVLDRKGHTRALKDPQRIYNYNASAAVEYGALQSKIPYIAPAEAIAGYEPYWETANTTNHTILPYRSRDPAGNEIKMPQRQPPPMSAPVFLEGMQAAAEDMRLVTGQYEAQMGAPSNESSGVAIERRQRQGDNATYHFIDHQAISMRALGKIIIDLVPHIYETKRVLKIVGEANDVTQVTIDPQAAQAMQVQQEKTAKQIKQVLFNPNVGRYDVEVDIGPAYATKRQEAFAALTQLASQNKEIVAVAGDLIMLAADFPMADEVAERLKRTIPANILGEGPPPEVTQLQAQVQTMGKLIEVLQKKLEDKSEGHQIERVQKGIDAAHVGLDAYDSETKRLAALKDFLLMDSEFLQVLIRKELKSATGDRGAGPDAGAAAGQAEQASAPPNLSPAPVPATPPQLNGAQAPQPQQAGQQ